MPGERSRRAVVAAVAMASLLAISLFVSAGARRTACRVPGLRSLCAAVGIGDVPSPAEQALWDAALAQDGCDGLRAYLRTYPRGGYVDEARARLEGRRFDPVLGPERDIPYVLTVNPRRAFPTESAARRDAQERGNQDAITMCKPREADNLVQLLTSRAAPRVWKCSEGPDGFTCGFDGKLVCRVRDWIKLERCRH